MNICVYGAASHLIDKKYTNEAYELGELMAKKGHKLVFGAGNEGMMGAVARGVHENGGKMTGVIPTFFNVDGIEFKYCDEIIRTETMRERKQEMEQRADAFIVTSGGVGTFEEFFEILTLKQLGRHEKPIVIINTDNYYTKLIEFLESSCDKKFLTKECLNLYKVVNNATEAIDYIENYIPKKYNLLEVRAVKL